MRLLLSAIWILGSFLLQSKAESLETIVQWSFVDFAFPYDRGFIGEFRAENVVPTGIEIGWHRVFVSMPRLRAGVPATLAYIPKKVPKGSSPQLEAYPSWDWHSAGKNDLMNCTGLISVYRTRIDRCNRLWVLDSGIMTSIDDFRPVCSPKLMVFDLQTDKLVRRIVFPREVLRPNTLLTNLVIDETAATTCDDVFVYMTDTAGPGILVFDGATDRSWRVVHASMYPHPDYSMYQIGGDTFELMDGVVGLTFSPKLGTVYYQPLATDRLFSVPTSALKAGPLPFGEQLPVTLVGRKSSQGLPLAVDPRDDTILFSPLTETAIAAWNPQTNQQRIVAFSPEKLQFTAAIRWAERDNGQFWAMSTRFHKFFRREANNREINIRVMRIKLEDQIAKPAAFYQHPLPPYFALNFYNNTLGF